MSKRIPIIQVTTGVAVNDYHWVKEMSLRFRCSRAAIVRRCVTVVKHIVENSPPEIKQLEEDLGE